MDFSLLKLYFKTVQVGSVELLLSELQPIKFAYSQDTLFCSLSFQFLFQEIHSILAIKMFTPNWTAWDPYLCVGGFVCVFSPNYQIHLNLAQG